MKGFSSVIAALLFVFSSVYAYTNGRGRIMPARMQERPLARDTCFVLHDDATESLSSVFIIRECRGRFLVKAPSCNSNTHQSIAIGSYESGAIALQKWCRRS